MPCLLLQCGGCVRLGPASAVNVFPAQRRVQAERAWAWPESLLSGDHNPVKGPRKRAKVPFNGPASPAAATAPVGVDTRPSSRASASDPLAAPPQMLWGRMTERVASGRHRGWAVSRADLLGTNRGYTALPAPRKRIPQVLAWHAGPLCLEEALRPCCPLVSGGCCSSRFVTGLTKCISPRGQSPLQALSLSQRSIDSETTRQEERINRERCREFSGEELASKSVSVFLPFIPSSPCTQHLAPAPSPP